MDESSSSDEETAVEHDIVLDPPAAEESSTLHVSTSKDNHIEQDQSDGRKRKTFLAVLGFVACVGAIIGLSVGLSSSDQSDEWPEFPSPTTDTGTSSATAVPWPHDSSDIEADPRVTYGVLDNGLRYAILPNSEPRDKLMLRMHIAAGSYQEEDDQRGLAHFLEVSTCNLVMMQYNT